MAEPTKPTAPSSFALSVYSDTTAIFTWSDDSTDETGFKIYDSEDNLIATFAEADIETGTVTDLTGGTTYSFYLVAYNDAGNSDPTETVTFTTQNTYYYNYNPTDRNFVQKIVNNVTYPIEEKVVATSDNQALVQYFTSIETRLGAINASLSALNSAIAALDLRVTALEGA